ncbi:hypothetical protein AMES_1591 [Amycolatopsis mediterranei S699]|uniref:DUF4878 domain-containing protein n=1 Tax=Amycolatopsis mediterranei (strain U-32) TaxID=749927 RepID=A0A0H3CZP8_AMYMU|nr:hypothetical protein [Amycolatopsis mediterranei]ADJ43414.1 hypothetical protein AMED_1601 [Amycolatopsis mediterranei U32]AFO75127.1 hypothetical protein AMES_1591 [Amycolatopsis mediterranei S699]AGT82256.1 hypothetical protein B737_1592 [Amycolatopsis mediterranei RB]KDO11681.1 hypothetical protein DV26_06495 [Amycolatopsis mediterranei]KDU90956.1 hypothetical protein DV36_16890 [Amycolatopsis mediterranei]
MHIRRDVKVGLSVAAALVWIGAVTLLIVHQPDPGAATPAELRDRLASALSGHDADAFADLLDYPGSGGGDFAKDYVSVLADRGVHAVHVDLGPDAAAPTRATVSGALGDGQPFSYPLTVTSEDGRWTIAFTPPLP